MKIKDYIALTKPGIVRSNVMTAAAAYLFASDGSVDWLGFVLICLGTMLVIACGCVLNNIMDIDIDRHMERTKKRALVTGKISIPHAQRFAYGIGIIGLIMLWVFANFLTAAIGLIAVVLYVYAYGWAKRKTKFATEIGTLPGAASIAAGYTAVTGTFDSVAFALVLVMVFWQMAHFLAITLFRAQEYAAASISVLPLRKGDVTTQKRIMVSILAFTVSLMIFAMMGSVGVLVTVVFFGMGLYWLYVALNDYQQKPTDKWGRKMFGYSLLTLMIFSGLIALVGIVG